MRIAKQTLSNPIQKYFDSEKSGGILLIICTAISILITNSSSGADYASFWQTHIGGLSLEHWINDALMAIFFLFIGLELERAFYIGELSSFQNALLPIFAAFGGIVTPALIHFSLNAGMPTQAGIGIPMATDIVFSLAVLAVLGNRVPASLKMFVVSFAVIDDLSAIVMIAAFYTEQLLVRYLSGALAIWTLLLALNRFFRVMSLAPYLLGGVLIWLLMLKSGVHPTVAGVILAFAVPFSAKDDGKQSPSRRLELFLRTPVTFIILPIFALANAGIVAEPHWMQNLADKNSVGILVGLIVGKPLGVTFLCLVVVTSGICRLPPDLSWRHIFGAGILGGIGFTMSIFIANLAFAKNTEIINASKTAILAASLTAGTTGFLWLKFFGKPRGTDSHPETRNLSHEKNRQI